MPLAADLDTTVQNFADKRHVLVCLDFDGAVAELVADAMAATPVPVNAEAVERLSDLKGVDLAYVSGRPLDTLRQLAAPPAGTLLVGSHGAEKDLGPDSPGLDLDSAQQRARRNILQALEGIVDRHDGAWLERKPAGGAIHVRRIDDDVQAESVLQEAREALAQIDGVYPKEGKKILEAVVLQSTKGEAIEELRTCWSPRRCSSSATTSPMSRGSRCWAKVISASKSVRARRSRPTGSPIPAHWPRCSIAWPTCASTSRTRPQNPPASALQLRCGQVDTGEHAAH